MPITPIRDINEYRRMKEYIRNMNDSKRSGDQTLFTEQTKIFQPILTSQQETAKAIQEKIVANQEQNALSPLVRELQRRNDQVDMLAEQPFYREQIAQQITPQIAPQITQPIAQSTPTKDKMSQIDLDYGLNTTDKENLEDLNFDLPSIVYSKNSYVYTLDQIKIKNKSLGQYLGTGAAGKKTSERNREIYESQKSTLVKYKKNLEAAKTASDQLLKKGEGLRKKNKNNIKKNETSAPIDVIPYSNTDDLVHKLEIFNKAKSAGNTGLDNHINSILDELLRVGFLNKDDYDECYKEIFKK